MLEDALRSFSMALKNSIYLLGLWLVLVMLKASFGQKRRVDEYEKLRRRSLVTKERLISGSKEYTPQKSTSMSSSSSSSSSI